ncbi:TfoX/Sxy family protein [Microbacterium sp.]|uniref:TfoX/Sxy family protein n=1 Tax=Microbacterium sp. TaxID=51671 RepID=UPI003A92F240
MSTDLREELTARVRAVLDTDTPVREVSMFGGRAVMVNDKVLVGAGKDGALLVHVDQKRHDELTARPGAAQAQMGAGRNMGRGWLRVTADAIETDDDLTFWVGVALEYNRATTG